MIEDKDTDVAAPKPWTTPKVIVAELRHAESGNGTGPSDFTTGVGSAYSS